MKAKKTIEVIELISYANKILAMPQTDIITKDFKEGVISMLEKSLHLTNNYKGFMFIDNNDSDVNTLGYVTRRYFV